MAKEIDPQILRKLLRYEPETGKIYWSSNPADFVGVEGVRIGNRIGRECFTRRNSGGYLCGDLFGKPWPAHRVAWATWFGFWPCLIDHINGNRMDNRLANLRAASSIESNRNRSRFSNNSSGMTGVHWHNRDCRWYAVISDQGRQKHLGYFATREEAILAREAAGRSLGYHNNHGRTAA